MRVPACSSPATQLPEDVVSCVLDSLRLDELIVVSHICRLWRRAAHNHRTFWGSAAIYKTLDAPAVDLFLARLAQAGIGQRPVSVTIRPSCGLSHSQAHLSTMRNRLAPALAATLAHITELEIEVPAELAECTFDALRQAAPALRSFRITNWKEWKIPTVIPRDIFATCARQLTALTVADGVRLPDEAVPAFQAVERVKFLKGSYNVFLLTRLDILLDRFPCLRNLAAWHQTMSEQAVASLTPQHRAQISRMESLSLDVRSLMNIRTVQNVGRSITSIRLLEINFDEFRERNPPPIDPQAIALLMPQQSEEMYCWVSIGRTNFAFIASPGLPFMRRTNTDPTELVGARLWIALGRHTKLVALSIDVGHWDLFRCDTAELPALEELHIYVLTQLPRQKTGPRYPPVRSPCLEQVIFRSRRDRADPGCRGPAIVTVRGIDEFLHASLSGCVWTSVDILLIDVYLYGPETVPETRISSIRMSSREECSTQRPRTALLMEHAHEFERLE